MKNVNASIITIGDELLIGQTIDTNSAWIGQELNKIGVWLKRRVAVGDVWDDIWNALDAESKESDIIIITGGLGPTADDITKPLLCKYFGGKLIVNEDVLTHVKYLFDKVYRRPGPMLERNLKQAEVPDVCTVLHNARGTAPGMWFEKDGKIYVSLPGVPHEMKGLMINEVLPRIPNIFNFPLLFTALLLQWVQEKA
jgi:nicotinamide-nucleotide amidase